MDHAGRTGDAFPWPERAAQPAAAFIFDENREITAQHKEHFLDFMRMCGISLPRRHEHDGQREAARRNDIGIAMLARAAGANETMLRAAIAVDLGILER